MNGRAVCADGRADGRTARHAACGNRVPAGYLRSDRTAGSEEPPIASAEFDLIIIGTGVAGRSAVEDAARAGLRTAIVDRRDFGGTCALRGCEPKKVLFAGAEAVERAGDQARHGVGERLTLDWGALVAFKRTFVVGLPAAFEEQFADMGVTALHGTARFVSPDALDVDGTRHTFAHVLVATGARPAPLGFSGEELVIDSERFMETDALPERVTFVGGGYVSMEFAHMAAAAGSRVTVLHRGRRVLEPFEPELSEMLVRGYRTGGIDVRTDAPVAAVRRAAGALEVVLADGTVVPTNLVVHGAGRLPDVEALDLVAGGVSVGRRGVEVDDHLRSVSNDRVYAAGDAAACSLPLSPVGIAQARVAVRNILEPGSASFDPLAVPSVVFSDPPLASVGPTEALARERGLDVDVRLTDTSAWVSTQRVGLTVSGAKTLVERGTGRIVAAHLLGHAADEAINVVAAAIAGGLTAADLKETLWAYPTAGSELVYLF
jgi:glutathione reductase (NADPH)